MRLLVIFLLLVGMASALYKEYAEAVAATVKDLSNESQEAVWKIAFHCMGTHAKNDCHSIFTESSTGTHDKMIELLNLFPWYAG